MIPSELKLVSLNHCFVHLPDIFLNNEPKLIAGSIISIKSIQNETELNVLWNGQQSPGNFAQLDITFAKANGLKEELIVLSFSNSLLARDCSLCRVELEESSDFHILKEHTDIRLLDTCRLIFKGIIIPLWVSKHIKIMVKVVAMEPNSDLGILTQATEMQYQHKNDEEPGPKPVETPTVKNPIDFVSHSLSINSSHKLWPGALLVLGEAGSGKSHFLKTVMQDYSMCKSELYDCKQLRAKKAEVAKQTLLDLLKNALDNQPFIIGLDDLDSFVGFDQKFEDEKGQEVIYRERLVECFRQMIKAMERTRHQKGSSVAIIATSKSLDSIDPRISKPRGRTYFGETLKIESPSLEKRVEIIRSLFAGHKQITLSLRDEELEKFGNQCRSFMPNDLKRLVERSIINASSRSLIEFNSEPLEVQEVDLYKSLEGYTPINLRGLALQAKNSTKFSDVGGMEKIKDVLKRTILLQLKYPKLFEKCQTGNQMSVLLYGPPGCGKTLIAEALANEESLNSICVRGPELLSKYIGASESAVRDLFERAKLARPCVIFFDEFESLVSQRGCDSTGVTDRVVNQFLTIMDGVERMSSDVFIIAASSRPDMIDPAILRPGRLDKHVYCPPPDQAERLAILKILSRDVIIEERDTTLTHWARQLEGFTGADIQSLLYSAQMISLHEIVDSNTGTDAPTDIVLKQSHVHDAYENMRAEVEKRSADISSKYPPTIMRSSNLVATRVTLN